jgi:translation elongation factor EF-Ts
LSFTEINATNQEQFNEQKLAEVLPTADLTDNEKLKQINDLVLKITDGTIKALTASISSLRTDDIIVDDQTQISEFLNNCSAQVFTAIRDAAIEKRNASNLKPLKFTCSQCNKDYEQPLILDLSNFFGRSS